MCDFTDFTLLNLILIFSDKLIRSIPKHIWNFKDSTEKNKNIGQREEENGRILFEGRHEEERYWKAALPAAAPREEGANREKVNERPEVEKSL